MEAVKLNVQHWHLSDDQGFRVVSRRHELLQQKGSDGLYYTQPEIRHIVDYAAARGIRVLPEFDVPGHCTSWLVGYPELGSAPGPYSIARAWGILKPVLNPADEKVYAFLDSFFGEMAALFPDEFFHIGGDEVLDDQWKANPRIQQFAAAHGLASGHDLQAYFNQRVQAILQKHGKKMVGWDEILRPDLPRDIVVQSWRGQASLAEAAVQGYRGILSFGYYLDHLRPAAFHYAVDPLSGKAQTLTTGQQASILGGEACMWSEYVTSENVDSRIWPRTAPMAERLWSPAGVTGVDSMYARMEQVSRNLEFTGVRHRSYTLPALQRLAGEARTDALEVLAGAVEANRLDLLRSHKFTSRVPLNRLVDAVPPESETVRQVEQAIAAHDYAYVRSTLMLWRDNYAQFRPVGEKSFLLQEALPLSENLSQAGSIGLEALGYLEGKSAAPAGWADRQNTTLARLDQPFADVTLAAVRAVKALVQQTR
jgi:hexosaminidase